ncbi:hypothetical protein L1987_63924 [Smallanthus sonchifolius]|uniref:Uncharacterized protein n=1 Tax=Smallanthus sonchifolius TaxID=185202 RepID=A0ACB9CF08_9ASTR|nr:hypothetical protein L1987_63924 [Smallanthus sonchifolius]
MFAANITEPRRNRGPSPKCNKCGYFHTGTCNVCARCNKFGHQAPTCRVKLTVKKEEPNSGCFECGVVEHFKKDCPKLKNNEARGRAFVMDGKKAKKDPSVISGTFLVNNHYACVLFDTGADRSFVSKKFEPLLSSQSSKLNVKYSIELANGKLIETNEVFRGCNLRLGDHTFSIDLLPVELGSFDVVIGMDWLSKNHAEIVCSEKIVQLALPSGKVLKIQGDESAPLKIVTMMKAHKYLRKGYPVFLAHVVDTRMEEKKLEEILIVRDYPEVFPEELPGLPPQRQVEFKIDLVFGAVRNARVIQSNCKNCWTKAS